VPEYGRKYIFYYSYLKALRGSDSFFYHVIMMKSLLLVLDYSDLEP